jgi:hypothetical protein
VNFSNLLRTLFESPELADQLASSLKIQEKAKLELGRFFQRKFGILIPGAKTTVWGQEYLVLKWWDEHPGYYLVAETRGGHPEKDISPAKILYDPKMVAFAQRVMEDPQWMVNEVLMDSQFLEILGDLVQMDPKGLDALEQLRREHEQAG